MRKFLLQIAKINFEVKFLENSTFSKQKIRSDRIQTKRRGQARISIRNKITAKSSKISAIVEATLGYSAN